MSARVAIFLALLLCSCNALRGGLNDNGGRSLVDEKHAHRKLFWKWFQNLFFPSDNGGSGNTEEEVTGGDGGFTPIRINCGGNARQAEGKQWAEDGYYLGGIEGYDWIAATFRGAASPDVFQTYRRAIGIGGTPLEYNIGVPNGRYDVYLYFPDKLNPFQSFQFFDVLIEGSRVYNSQEIKNGPTGPAGSKVMTTESVEVTDGMMDIELHSVTEISFIGAIEIVAGSQDEPVKTLRPTTKPTATPTMLPTTASPTALPTASPSSVTPTTMSPTVTSSSATPTSDAPVSAAPTTSSPTTSPSSAAPTSDAPVSAAPTTSRPTVSPTSLAPVSSAPISAAPTTSSPTVSPTSLAPVSSAPISAAPTTSSPTVGPTSLAPISSAPTSAAPTTSSPTGAPTVSPTTPAPTTLSPTTIAPVSSAPTTIAPTTSNPTASPTVNPTTPAPSTAILVTVAPTTMSPTTVAPSPEPITALPTPAPSPEPAPASGKPLSIFFMNAGGEAYTDTKGNVWISDTSHVQNFAGIPYTNDSASVTGSNKNDRLYQTERFGEFEYVIPTGNGVYEVTLFFAEVFHVDANKRVFNVFVEGDLKFANVDIFAEVGSWTALTKKTTVTVNDETLSIEFKNLDPPIDFPKVSAVFIRRMGV